MTLHNFKNNKNNTKFEIEEVRRKVGSLLAQSMTENEIAEELGVEQSTISRDIKALKELSQQFTHPESGASCVSEGSETNATDTTDNNDDHGGGGVCNCDKDRVQY
jgi:IS30 family transposase